MPETTESYHRVPVSSGHDSHEIRTITVSESDGIKALYCVDCSEIVTYLFDVDEWTMEEAKEWVDSHKEDACKPNAEKVGNMKNGFLDMRTKERIGSTVRYKSHGTFLPKGAGEGGDEMYVRGFFTSDNMDEVGDIITREATTDAVKRWRKWGNIRTMHSNPSGRVEKIGEEDGLEWNELVTVPVDEDTKKLIDGGVLKAYSVGIIPREYEVNEDALEEGDDPWFLPLIIHSYDMVEISYVDHPANYDAAMSEVINNSRDKSHRAVLFKRSDIMGDADNMKEKEAEVNEELEQEDVELEPEVEDVEGEHDSEEPVDDVVEAGAEEPEVEEEDVVEKDEEEEFDVALAVSDIKSSLGGLEERFSSLEESLDSLADMLVERLLDAMSPEEPAMEDVGEDEDEEKEMEPDVSKGVDFDIEKFSSVVAEKVLDELVDVFVPESKRKALVASEDDGDGDDAAVKSSEEKTKMYLSMTPQERREKLKEMLSNSVNK